MTPMLGPRFQRSGPDAGPSSLGMVEQWNAEPVGSLPGSATRQYGSAGNTSSSASESMAGEAAELTLRRDSTGSSSTSRSRDVRGTCVPDGFDNPLNGVGGSVCGCMRAASATGVLVRPWRCCVPIFESAPWPRSLFIVPRRPRPAIVQGSRVVRISVGCLISLGDVLWVSWGVIFIPGPWRPRVPRVTSESRVRSTGALRSTSRPRIAGSHLSKDEVKVGVLLEAPDVSS